MDLSPELGTQAQRNIWKMICSENFAVCGSVCAPAAYIVYLHLYWDISGRGGTNAGATGSEKNAVDEMAHLKLNHRKDLSNNVLMSVKSSKLCSGFALFILAKFHVIERLLQKHDCTGNTFLQ